MMRSIEEAVQAIMDRIRERLENPPPGFVQQTEHQLQLTELRVFTENYREQSADSPGLSFVHNLRASIYEAVEWLRNDGHQRGRIGRRPVAYFVSLQPRFDQLGIARVRQFVENTIIEEAFRE